MYIAVLVIAQIGAHKGGDFWSVEVLSLHLGGGNKHLGVYLVFGDN